MITTLLVVALVLTLLIALMLPFGGFGSGADAAGRGMAMFLPSIMMLVRACCVCAAIVIAAFGGALAWLGVGVAGAAAIGLAIAAAAGAMSFHSAIQLTSNPSIDGRGPYAFLAAVVSPVVVSLWLFSETYGVEQNQNAAALAVVALSLAASAVFMQRDIRAEIADVAADRLRRETETAEAQSIASSLPPDATLLELLRQLERLPEPAWQARELVERRVSLRPALKPELIALLESSDWTARITAGIHMLKVSMDATPDYFRVVRPTLDEIIRRLETNAAERDILAREARAAIALAWPAINNDGLPKPLMERLHRAIEEQSGDSRFAALVHDARMLADMVTG